ncbi:MAG: hypothetical protein U9N13_04850 [Euryarchaeota archaeon]|nr:hypothetical protein [Euryarchaeota archaeon]
MELSNSLEYVHDFSDGLEWVTPYFINSINSSLDNPDCLIIEIKVPFGTGFLF